MVKDRGAWLAAVHGVTKRHDLATEQQHCPQPPRKGLVFLGKNLEGIAQPLSWVSEGKITWWYTKVLRNTAQTNLLSSNAEFLFQHDLFTASYLTSQASESKKPEFHRFREWIYGYQDGWWGIDWEFGNGMHTHTAIFKIKCLPMKNKYKQNFFKDLSLNPGSAI